MGSGKVFIAEDLDQWAHVDVADLVRRGVDLRTLSPGDVMSYTGRFFAHWQSDDDQQFEQGPHNVSVEKAIEWGRSRADVVWARVGDGDLGGDEERYFSAGTQHPDPDVPVWPDGMEVIARPYTGTWRAWKDGFEMGGSG